MKSTDMRSTEKEHPSGGESTMEGTGSEQRMVRDAARLRAVMGRSSDQNHESNSNASLTLPDVENKDVAGESQSNEASTEATTSTPTAATPDARATRLIAPKIIRTVPEERREYSRYETHLRAPVREKPPIVEDEKEMVPVATPKPSPPPYFERTILYAQLEETPTIRLDEDPRSSNVPLVATKRIRGFTPLVGLAIVVGLGVGVGLYAMFGDQISGLFSGQRESIASGNPAMVTERPAELDVASASIDGGLATDPTTIEAPATSSPDARQRGETPTETSQGNRQERGAEVPPPVSESAPRSQRDVEPVSRTASTTARTTAASATTRETNATREAAAREATQREAALRESRVRQAAARETMVREATSTQRGTAAEVTSATTAQRYTVQIRSTSDETEATRIAQRLRSKGAKNVRVEKWSKDGTEMYRVRYGAFASSSEAQSESERLGHDNIWIVKRP